MGKYCEMPSLFHCVYVCVYYVLQVDPLAVSVLTAVQEEAVDYVRKKSKADSHRLYPALCEKVMKLGYSPKDLQKLVMPVYDTCS